MKKNIYILSPVILTCFILYSVAWSQYQPGQIKNVRMDIFDAGLKLKEEGNFENALETWYQGKETFENCGKIDPRIGIAYIELAAEIKDRKYYEDASELYMWAFSDSSITLFKDEIKEEVERIKPLLDDEEIKEWDTLIENNDPSILTNVRRFWLIKDLTPTTAINERLLEHWERIAYARNSFTQNARSPYGTDDRGTIYVRYGAPDKKRTGTLGSDFIELRRRMEEVKRDNLSTGTVRLKDRHGNAIVVQVPSGEGAIRDRFGNSVNMSYINFLHWNPEYEIWIYNHIHEEDQVMYIFGRPETSRFKLLHSIEELISDNLFSRRSDFYITNSWGTRNFSPGALIQLMYYNQLKLVDPFFADRYYELETVWERNIAARFPPSSGMSAAIRSRFIYRDKNDPAKRDSPKEKTDLEDNFIPVNILTRQVRRLDENNKPTLSVIAFSYPEERVVEKLQGLFTGKSAQFRYNPTHTLIIRDRNWNEINRLTDNYPDRRYNLSTFLISQEDATNNLTLAANTFANIPVLANSDSTVLVPFIGKVELEKTLPLESDFAKLEVSDFITGVRLPENIETRNYPFPVLLSDQISKGDLLEVYFEIYHLRIGQDNRAHYTISFQLEKPKKEGLLARLFKKQEKEIIATTSTFDAGSNRVKELVAFDISDLEAADYEFQITVIDLLSKQQKIRKGKFKVVN